MELMRAHPRLPCGLTCPREQLNWKGSCVPLSREDTFGDPGDPSSLTNQELAGDEPLSPVCHKNQIDKNLNLGTHSFPLPTVPRPRQVIACPFHVQNKPANVVSRRQRCATAAAPRQVLALHA